MSHVTKAVVIEVFFDPKNEIAIAGINRLVKISFPKPGSIHERSLTKFAAGHINRFRGKSALSIYVTKPMCEINSLDLG